MSRLKKRYSLQKYLFVFLGFLSLSSWILFHFLGLSLAYNDSMSHLNISRMVIDNLEPGFSQLGGVWLPLPHILPLFLVWNDWAWQSGFASSLFSMTSFLLSCFGIYQIVNLITKNRLAAVLGTLTFALNLNMLYLQSTPLTEPMYIGIFVLSALVFLKWLIVRKSGYLLLLGILGFFQVITRYDGWFVVGMTGILIAILEYFRTKKKNINHIFGKLILFSFPIAFGIFIWLCWNSLIFGDPLYFALGPHSARSQQDILEASGGLITKHNLWISLEAYSLAVIKNIGLVILLFSLLGVFVYFCQKIKGQVFSKMFFLVFLLLPIIFNVLALFLGFSSINLPELNWKSGDISLESWFNVRYGILALPLVAVLMGIFASFGKRILYLSLFLIVLQSYITLDEGIVTILDGTVGASAYRKSDVSDQLKKRIRGKETLLISTAVNNPVAFKSGVNLKNVIHEGVSKHWFKALKEPEKYADWLVISNGSNGDPLYESLIQSQNTRLADNYILVYKGKEANIYQLKIPRIVSTAQTGTQ